MTLMLWAVPTSPTRRMRRRGAPASDSLISGPRRRAPCPPPGTVASVPSCCARNASASGPNSSLSYVITDYRWEVVKLSKSPDTKLIIVRLSSWRHRWTSVRHVFVVFPTLLALFYADSNILQCLYYLLNWQRKGMTLIGCSAQADQCTLRETDARINNKTLKSRGNT